LLLLLLGGASSAQAGTYVVHACRMPDGSSAGVSGWVQTVYAPSIDERGQTCGQGGSIFLNMYTRAHAAEDYGHLSFTAPADTLIDAYVIWRSVLLGDTYNYRYWEIRQGGALSDCGHDDSKCNERDRCHTGEGCLTRGVDGDPLASDNKVTTWQLHGLSGLVLSVTCGASGGCPANPPGAILRMYRADVRLSDDAPPSVTGTPSGSLAAGGTVSGTLQARLDATDRGGGLQAAMVEVDGQVVARSAMRDGACQAPYQRPVPCPLSSSATLSFDTRSVSDGPHAVRLLVSDVAGNVTAWPSSGPVSIRVANRAGDGANASGGLETAGSNGPCQAATGKLRQRVVAQAATRAGRRGRRALTVAFRRSAYVSGRITEPGGSPVAGARICVLLRTDRAGASERAVGTVQSDGDGRFAFTLPAGPSRRVRLRYRTDAGTTSATVRVLVPLPVSLRIRPTHVRAGGKIRFEGRLQATGRRGVPVELQVRDGRRWRTFDSVTTRRHGTYAYTYVFSRRPGLRRFAFRALVRRQSSLAYSTGRSTVRRVTVRG
jgi:hypothetical protein